MQISTDGNGNKFFRFKNVRVSVKHVNKDGPKDWEGNTARYLQILAYRDATSTATHPGPQIPIDASEVSDDESILAIVWRMLKAAT